MIKLNHLSDNQLRMFPITLDGLPIDPNTMWMKVYLRSAGRTFCCVNDPTGVETKHCHIDDKSLILDIPSRRLRPGVIEYMIEVRESSDCFADGYKNTYSSQFKSIEIELT